MNTVATSLLSLAGSLSAVYSLASGEAIRPEGPPRAKRFTPRMVLSLVCLGAAELAGLADMAQTAGGMSLFAGLPSFLFAMGTGLILWVFLTGSRQLENKTLAERLTRRGQVGLGLLLAGQLSELASGRALVLLKNVLPSGPGTLVTLGALGTILVVLGIAAAAALYRSGSLLLPRDGFILKRLSVPAKATVLCLALALVLVGLANLLAPGVEPFMSLLFLVLGITTGMLALWLDGKAVGAPVTASWGISPRGWVSLGLLALTAVTLGAQSLRFQSARGEQEAETARDRGQVAQAAQPVLDGPSAWSLRLPVPEESELDRVKRQLAAAKASASAAQLTANQTTSAPQEKGKQPAPIERGTELAAMANKLSMLIERLDALSPVVKTNHPEVNPFPQAPARPDPGKEQTPFEKKLNDIKKEMNSLLEEIAKMKETSKTVQPAGQ